MAGSSDANNVPEGTTLVFGSWACTADETDLDEKRVPTELDSNNPENVSTPNRTLGSIEFDTISNSEKIALFQNSWKIHESSQHNKTP